MHRRHGRWVERLSVHRNNNQVWTPNTAHLSLVTDHVLLPFESLLAPVAGEQPLATVDVLFVDLQVTLVSKGLLAGLTAINHIGFNSMVGAARARETPQTTVLGQLHTFNSGPFVDCRVLLKESEGEKREAFQRRYSNRNTLTCRRDHRCVLPDVFQVAPFIVKSPLTLVALELGFGGPF